MKDEMEKLLMTSRMEGEVKECQVIDFSTQQV